MDIRGHAQEDARIFIRGYEGKVFRGLERGYGF